MRTQGLRKFYELVMQAILRHVRFDGEEYIVTILRLYASIILSMIARYSQGP